MRRLSLLILTLVWSWSVMGQNYPMLHYSKEDGIPSNVVYNVYRDSKGYIWIATDKGVARYNGIKFETFTTLDGLADNEVYFFQEDIYGRLWLATGNGELCYYRDGIFNNAANTPFLKLPFISPHISSMELNADSSVSINYEDLAIVLTVFRDSISVNSAELINDSMRVLCLRTKRISAGNFELTYKKVDIIIDNSGKTKQVVERDFALGFHKFTQNQSYFYNSEHIYSTDKKVIRRFPAGFLDRNLVYSLFEDKANFFAGTDNGLFINDTINILRDKRVSATTVDNAGTYWISTLDNGIYCLSKNFIRTSKLENSYAQSVRYCYQDTSCLFFATTENNLYLLDRHRNVSCLFEYKKHRVGSDTRDHDAVHLIDRKLNQYNYYAIHNDSRVYISDVGSPNERSRIVDHTPASYAVKSLLATDKDLYVHSRRSVERMADVSGFLEHRVARYFSTNSASSYRIFAIAKTRNNTIFSSTVEGLYKIVNDSQVYQPQFNEFIFGKFEILGNYLVGVTMDSRLVICNNIDGEVAIDRVNNQNCIWQKLFPLDSNHVIVSTNNLYRIITLSHSDKEPKYSIFTIENPFIPPDAEGICSDGRYCNFFKNGSITSIELKSLLVRSVAPEVFFTFLSTGRKSYPIRDELSLRYSEAKSISVSFSVLSFSGKNVSFQYSISGNEQENDWRDISGNEININSLTYGDYFIKVRAKTISSEYSKPVFFSLHISQPAWTTWWFIALCICAALVIVFAIIRYRVRQAMSKKEKEHDNEVKYLRAEYTAMNALMNPHFIFNTLNNVQSLFHENDLVGANEYLKVFAELIRQNMQNISKELIPLQMEIDLVTKYLYLEKMRFEDKLNFSVNIDKGVDAADIMVPPLLIQPIVENSIKHGILPLDSEHGFISINIFERGDVLYIEVKDNGQGLKHPANQDNAHESLGLGNIKKRIHHLGIIQNRNITFHIAESQTETGEHEYTIVTIGLPV